MCSSWEAGAFFQDVTSVRSPLYIYPLVIGPQNLPSAGNHLYAQGSAPGDVGPSLAAGVALRLAHRVSLRDEESLELVGQACAPNLEANVSADPAYIHHTPQPLMTRISLGDLPGLGPALKSKLDEIASAVDSLQWL